MSAMTPAASGVPATGAGAPRAPVGRRRHHMLRQGSYVVLDLNTAWHASKHLDITASLVNALDRKYSDSSANNLQNISLGLPRIVTVGLRARF